MSPADAPPSPPSRARAIAALALLAIVTAVLAAGLPPRKNFQVEDFFPVSDPALETFTRFKRRFEDTPTRALLAVHEDGGVFRTASLEDLTAMARRLEAMPEVRRATALSNFDKVVGDETTLHVRALADPAPSGEAALAALRKRTLADPVLVNAVVSPDGRTAGIEIQMKKSHDTEQGRRRLWEQVQAIGREFTRPGRSFHAAGTPLNRARYVERITQDQGRYLPAALGLTLLLLAVGLRSLRDAVLPALVVVLSCVWVLGGMGWTGARLTFLTMTVPVVLLIVGVSDSVHMVLRHRDLWASTGAPGPALRRTVREIGGACLMTSITTAAGFGVLAWTNMVLLREYGLVTGLGVLAAYAVTMLLLPSALAFRRRFPGGTAGAAGPTPMQRALEGLARSVLHRPGACLAAALLLLGLPLAGLGGLRREARLLDDLPESDPILRDNRFIERELGGALAFEVVVDSGTEGGVLEPQVLAGVDRLTARMARELRGMVGSARSAADYVKDLHRAVHADDPAEYRLPDTRARTAQYVEAITLAPDIPLWRYLDWTRRRARIQVKVYDVGQQATEKLFARVQEMAREELAPGCRAELTGNPYVIYRVYRMVVDGMTVSFAAAFAVVALFMGLLFRSVRLLAISLVPNVVPLLSTLGVMGLLGVDLKPSTAIVFSIAFGLAVDDTIHFLTRYRHERLAGADREQAVHRTIVGAGRAMVYTSLILAGGFSILLLSSFTANVQLGLLVALTVVFALVGDLLLLPLLVLRFGLSWTALENEPPRRQGRQGKNRRDSPQRRREHGGVSRRGGQASQERKQGNELI